MSVPSSPNALVETSFRGALCERRADHIEIASEKFSHPPFAVFEKPAWASSFSFLVIVPVLPFR